MSDVQSNPLSAPFVRASAPPALVRLAFWVGVGLLTVSLWLAPRLPMVDLPQHAGQVALWRDMLRGVSPFADELRVALFTPYLIGYGLALPLSFVVDASEAVRIVLAGAFLAWVAAAQGLRREVDGDPRLDWLFLFGFFGFAYAWGFYTFLVAAPVALLATRLAIRYCRAPSLARGAALTAAGVALLWCHGLQFLFALAVHGAIVLERAAREWRTEGFASALRAGLRRSIPGFVLILAFAAFMLARQALVGPDPVGASHFGASVLIRPATAAIFVWGNHVEIGFLAVTLLAFALPLVSGGYRPTIGPGLAAFGVVVLILLFCVSTARGTGFIYERFALYLLPFWALALKPSQKRRDDRAFAPVLALIGLAACGLHMRRTLAFAQEDAAFAPILAAARPGERVATLAIDDTSQATGQFDVYLHWGAWLQATRGVFVDFNFAYFAPQIVRFKPDRVPLLQERQAAMPEEFEWGEWDAGRYDAFVVRGSVAEHDAFLAKTNLAKTKGHAACPLISVARSGEWAYYRAPRQCPR